MPYVAASASAVSEGLATSLLVDMPGGHQNGDLLVLFAQQDVGTGTLSLSGSWTEIGTQATANGQRTAGFYRWATSSSEPAVTLSSTLNDDLAAVVLAVRGVNATTPIDAQARTNTPATTSTFTSGTVTTTTSNCLVLHAFGTDLASNLLRPVLPHEIAYIADAVSVGGGLYVGSKNQAAAGVSSAVSMIATASNESGTILTVALRDDGAAQMAPELASSYTLLKHFSNFSTIHDATSWSAPNSLVASLDGLSTSSIAPIVTTATAIPDAGRTMFMGVQSTESTAGLWVGGITDIASVNLSGKTVSFRFAVDSPATSSLVGPKGIVLVLGNASGAWVAYRVSFYTGLLTNSTNSYQFVINFDSETPYGSNGTFDWTAVTKFGILNHRAGSAVTGRGVFLRGLVVLSGCAIVGGSAAAPVSPQAVANLLDGWTKDSLMNVQAATQSQAALSLQLGNGSVPAYIETTGAALAFRQRALAVGTRSHWKVADDKMEVRIRASASDTVRGGACVMTTDTRQAFVIDPASSPSASYDFDGLVLVGYRVENNSSGIALNGVTFSNGYRITLNGGVLSNCAIANCRESPAVLTSDPDNIIGTAFAASASGGHAIEITAPGTYTFAGNTFTGYGANGTTDAAIYNNSGGAVTLNITGGGSTPTVRNGAGASTTINSSVSVTLQGVVAGSAIQVIRTSDSFAVEFRVASGSDEVFSLSSGTAYLIRVRKASASPTYRPWSTQVTPTSDQSIFVSQEPDE